jgi:hypothetical protein
MLGCFISAFLSPQVHGILAMHGQLRDMGRALEETGMTKEATPWDKRQRIWKYAQLKSMAEVGYRYIYCVSLTLVGVPATVVSQPCRAVCMRR